MDKIDKTEVMQMPVKMYRMLADTVTMMVFNLGILALLEHTSVRIYFGQYLQPVYRFFLSNALLMTECMAFMTLLMYLLEEGLPLLFALIITWPSSQYTYSVKHDNFSTVIFNQSVVYN
ncbi:uncharacterized protein LOC143294940 [Babylonia areolata]|uniref:uncharacterized protein LOC143294940 n=1 Tax=Babylonia areolata TaxID=304850 RepID=UPI003FD6A7F7